MMNVRIMDQLALTVTSNSFVTAAKDLDPLK